MKKLLAAILALVISSPLNAGGLKVAGPSAPSSPLTLSSGANSSIIRLQNTNSGSNSTDGGLIEMTTGGDLNIYHYESGRLNLFVSNSLNINMNGTGMALGNVVPVNRLDVGGGAAIGSGFYGSRTAPTDGLSVQGNLEFDSWLVSIATRATIADNGGGTAASYTLSAIGSCVEVVCQDADGCNVTMSEASVPQGAMVRIVNVGNVVANFSDSAGLSELAGAFAMGEFDTLTLMYTDDRWIEVSRSNN